MSGKNGRQCQENTSLRGKEGKDFKGAAMKEQSPPVGFCMACGYLHYATEHCLVCGNDTAPFLMTDDELERGEVTMPGDIVVSGLDSPEARLMFLSDAGREAYAAAFDATIN